MAELGRRGGATAACAHAWQRGVFTGQFALRCPRCGVRLLLTQYPDRLDGRLFPNRRGVVTQDVVELTVRLLGALGAPEDALEAAALQTNRQALSIVVPGLRCPPGWARRLADLPELR